MSILAAKCPCCGRDIGIEENTEEYTCVFCGTKLKVAALKTTPVEEADKQSGAAEVKDAPVNGEHKSSAGGESERHGRHHSRHESVSPKEINAPELTREEIEEELKRKAEFKEELHSALHQINELRARRPKLEARLRTVTTLGIVGAILAVVAGRHVLLCRRRIGYAPDRVGSAGGAGACDAHNLGHTPKGRQKAAVKA